MTVEQQHETRVYLEFFEAVRDFNQANVIYLEEMHHLAQERQAALTQAVKRHLDPLLSNLRTVQLISGAAAAISFLVFFCASANRAASTNESVRGAGVFFFLLVIIGAVVFAWTSQRVSVLTAKIKQIQSGTWTDDHS